MSNLNNVKESPSDDSEAGSEPGNSGSNKFDRLRILFRQLGGSDATQRRSLRWVVIGAALVVVVMLIFLEYYILWCLTHTLLVYNEYFVFLCIAPIAAVVTILAFMLLGVFRVNSDLGSTPLEAIRELLLES